jgi:hypothetical protein
MVRRVRVRTITNDEGNKVAAGRTSRQWINGDVRRALRGQAAPRDTGKVPAFPGMVEWMYTLCFVPYHDQ